MLAARVEQKNRTYLNNIQRDHQSSPKPTPVAVFGTYPGRQSHCAIFARILTAIHTRRRTQKQARHRVLKGARITLKGHETAIDCVVRNLSDGGACLKVASPIGFRNTFDLVLDRGRPSLPRGLAGQPRRSVLRSSNVRRGAARDGRPVADGEATSFREFEPKYLEIFQHHPILN